MSKARLFLSLTATAGLLILPGGVGLWGFPLRTTARAAAVGSQSAEKETHPLVSTAIQPITKAAIAYPPAAKKAGIQGKVRLRVTINKDDSVMDIWVLSGPPQLVKASLEAVAQWRYSPSKEIRVTIVTITFTLRQGGTAPLPRPPA
jgi:TonB family protein